MHVPTGATELRESCAEVLRVQGWQVRRSVPLAASPKGGYIEAELLALDPVSGRRIIVIPRWQAKSGSAEEKVPFHIIKVQLACSAEPDVAQAAYFVLEGAGWTWRDYFVGGSLDQYLNVRVPTRCLTFPDFAALASRQAL